MGAFRSLALEENVIKLDAFRSRQLGEQQDVASWNGTASFPYPDHIGTNAQGIRQGLAPSEFRDHPVNVRDRFHALTYLRNASFVKLVFPV